MKFVGRLDLWKYYTLYGGMLNLFCRAGHYPCVQNLLWSIRRKNPPCNAEDNLCACRCTKVGVPYYPNLCTGSCSTLRQGTPRKRQEKTKHPRQGPRQEELAGPRRQGPGKRSLPGRPSPYKTIQEQSMQDRRSRPRQEELAGKAKPRHHKRSPPRRATRPGKA